MMRQEESDAAVQLGARLREMERELFASHPSLAEDHRLHMERLARPQLPPEVKLSLMGAHARKLVTAVFAQDATGAVLSPVWERIGLLSWHELVSLLSRSPWYRQEYGNRALHEWIDVMRGTPAFLLDSSAEPFCSLLDLQRYFESGLQYNARFITLRALFGDIDDWRRDPDAVIRASQPILKRPIPLLQRGLQLVRFRDLRIDDAFLSGSLSSLLPVTRNRRPPERFPGVILRYSSLPRSPTRRRRSMTAEEINDAFSGESPPSHLDVVYRDTDSVIVRLPRGAVPGEEAVAEHVADQNVPDRSARKRSSPKEVMAAFGIVPEQKTGRRGKKK